LDNSIDEGNDDCLNTLTQLRRITNAVSTFTAGDECIEFITTNSNEKVCMIISGSLGQLTVPLVHNMSQVDSIFILCGTQKLDEQWAKKWPKIKGVFTEVSPICESLKGAVQQSENNAIGMSFMPTSTGAFCIASDQLDCSLMYTQVIKEILLGIQFNEQDIQKFTKYCYEAFADNGVELMNIRKLERKYREETPIWWYTFECFLNPMLNRALCTLDVNIIIMMGFFITDLHRHIERSHTKQFGSHSQSQVLTVYRGQGLSKTDFDQLVKTKGELMSFNSFLSTSKNRNISVGFARKVISSPDMIGILFVMTIDSSLSSTPFASIANVSYFEDAEDEILFSMHTIFRIHEIKSIGENNRLWQVELTLTSNNDYDLRVHTEYIREEIFSVSKGWYRLGLLLLKMGQSRKAQQVYEDMLQHTSDDCEKAHIYHQLGCVKDNEGQYKDAVTFYKQSLEIFQKTLPPNHPQFAKSYNNIGTVYGNMGDYSKALSSYEKALEIFQKTFPPNHPQFAKSYNNIGTVYGNMGDYSKALSSYEKALEIEKKHLPAICPDFSQFYNKIGAVYYNMGEYSKALSYHERALAIRRRTLPPTHPDLASSYNNVGLMYSTMGEYSEALSFYERAVDIGQQSLPKDHPNLQFYRKALDLVKKKL
jgi:tetratricopeptide (TPR) repeat protein